MQARLLAGSDGKNYAADAELPSTVNFGNDGNANWSTYGKTVISRVRACLAF